MSFALEPEVMQRLQPLLPVVCSRECGGCRSLGHQSRRPATKLKIGDKTPITAGRRAGMAAGMQN